MRGKLIWKAIETARISVRQNGESGRAVCIGANDLDVRQAKLLCHTP